jgi:hypothetical protein
MVHQHHSLLGVLMQYTSPFINSTSQLVESFSLGFTSDTEVTDK